MPGRLNVEVDPSGRADKAPAKTGWGNWKGERYNLRASLYFVLLASSFRFFVDRTGATAPPVCLVLALVGLAITAEPRKTP